MNAYENLVKKLGEAGAKQEMSRRSKLATRTYKGYFHQLKQEGKLDELKKLQSEGGKKTMGKLRELNDAD